MPFPYLTERLGLADWVSLTSDAGLKLYEMALAV